MPEEMRSDGTIDALLRLMNDVEIDKAVCFAPFSYQMAGSTISVDSNTWLASILKGRPEFVGYGTLDPLLPPAPQVRQIADLGFRGIKLHPPAQKFELFGSWARQAYAAMEESGLIADFHMGVHWHRLKDYNPLDCDEIAFHHPNLRMVFEHVGGWHFYRQVLAVIVNNQGHGNHLYAGIASVLDYENQRCWYLGTPGLNECRWQIGSNLLIYGLDFPYNQAPQIRHDLETIRGLGWPPDEIAALLGGNIERLHGS